MQSRVERHEDGSRFAEVATVIHNGHEYTNGGAYYDGAHLFAYTAKRGGRTVIVDWAGNVIANTVHVTKTSTNNLGDKRRYMRFLFDGAVFSGWEADYWGYIRAHRTKLASIYG